MNITASARSWFKLSTNYYFGEADILLCSSAWRIYMGKRNILYLKLLMYWMLSDNFLNSRDHNPLFFLISWRLITSQYCSGFCHTLKWISHGFTCVVVVVVVFKLSLFTSMKLAGKNNFFILGLFVFLIYWGVVGLQ